MNCPKCNTLNNIDSKFCINCGQSLSDTHMTAQQQSKNINKKIIILVIIIIVALIEILAGILITINQNKKNISTSTSKQNNDIISSTIIDNSQETIEEQNTTYDENGTFLFSIEDVFTVTNRGIVATGNIQRGKVHVGDTVQLIGLNEEIITTEVISIEFERKQHEEATAGDNAGIFLKNVTREQVKRGQVLAKPNSIVSATKFDANIYMLTTEEGGRKTPVYNGYRPQFYFRTIDITGVVEFTENIKLVNPGDNALFTISLTDNVAMEIGTEFSIREGGRVLGKGTVTKIY